MPVINIYPQEVVGGILVQALVGAYEHPESALSIFTIFSLCPLLFGIDYRLSPIPISIVDEKSSTELDNQV